MAQLASKLDAAKKGIPVGNEKNQNLQGIPSAPVLVSGEGKLGGSHVHKTSHMTAMSPTSEYRINRSSNVNGNEGGCGGEVTTARNPLSSQFRDSRSNSNTNSNFCLV